MARRKGGRSQRSRKPPTAPGRGPAQGVEHETAKSAATAATAETEAQTATGTTSEARDQPDSMMEGPGARVEPEGPGTQTVDPGESASDETELEELELEAPEPGEPEPEEAAPELGVPEPGEPEPEEASTPVEATAGAEVDPPVPARAPAVDPDTTVVVSTEPQRPAAQVMQASPAAYGPEAVTPADGAVDGESGVPSGGVEGKAAWRRLFRMGRPRTTKANVLGALLAVALGVGIATQVQLTNERGLSELSQSDLIRLLDDISARSNRLDQQVRELEERKEALLSGTDSTGEALKQAQERADTLGILAGTLPAQGPGITVSISDPDRLVSGPVILDLVQELRDAGAESIDVGGVRVVASSFIGDAGGDLSVDGRSINRPILVKAIGDPNTLASAMTIPGGIVETIRQKGGNASVNESRSIAITSTHTPKPLTHAEPGQ